MRTQFVRGQHPPALDTHTHTKPYLILSYLILSYLKQRAPCLTPASLLPQVEELNLSEIASEGHMSLIEM
jgi:hypothetical protein